MEFASPSGYFYVSNRAGSTDLFARDLYVGNAPRDTEQPVVPEEPEEPTTDDSTQVGSWLPFGDTDINEDGTIRLNGNPGSVNDFVRTEESWSAPAYAEVTFDAGW
jgi:hypothetical protein